MQIKELVIYGINGLVRHIPFNIGKVNIISGKSKSGKSAIGDIIDYCMGGTSCNIADGVVRETVSWYGLLLQLDDERIFVARQSPPSGQQSTSKFYYEIGKNIVVPKVCKFLPNTNVEGIEEMLSRRLGITENLNIPPEWQTRLPLAANIRHALYYCFQNQDEIAARNFLFHKQSEDFITQAIKDTIPYFLGIINEESLLLESERTTLKRKLSLEKRTLEEERMLQGGGMQRAISLISEAKYAGLLNLDVNIDYDRYQSLYENLKMINEWRPVEIKTEGMNKLSFLQSQLLSNQGQLDDIAEEIRNGKKFIGETFGFVDEAEHQKMRLQSIGLFEELDFIPNHCPLCSGTLSEPLASVESIKAAIKNLSANIESVTREKPKLREFIDSLENEQQMLREDNNKLKAEIDGIYTQNQEALGIKDINSRRAKIVGRISLWLESVEICNNTSNKETSIKDIEQRLSAIDKLLDKDMVVERKQSILTRMTVDMSVWAKELGLENCEHPFRLDMDKVTVFVDKPERPVPLQQLGSGSNWVGIHLIAYFALHKYFVSLKRPVPRFIFIDQPSQVYFPSDIDAQNTDKEEVNNLYSFIFNRVNELKGNIQVIIVDHANLNNEDFQSAVIEKWWDGEKLIPKSWYEHKVDIK